MAFPNLSEATSIYAITLYGSLIILLSVHLLHSKLFDKTDLGFSRTLIRDLCPPILLALGEYTLFCETSLDAIIQCDHDFKNGNLFVKAYICYKKIRITVIRFLRRNAFLQSWTLQHAIIFTIYLGGNFGCVFANYSDPYSISLRSARLSLINFVLLFAGPHLSFVADCLGVRLQTFHHIHSATSLTVLILMVIHLVFGSAKEGFYDSLFSEKLFAFIAGITLTLQTLMFPLVLRVISYEVSIRIHHLTAILLAYSIWRHVPAHLIIYLYVSTGTFSIALMIQTMGILYQHKMQPCEAAAKIDTDSVHITLHLPKGRFVKVYAGQYINLWMPVDVYRDPYRSILGAFLSTRAAWQSHPFTVVSWSNKPKSKLELIVKRQWGWTQRLYVATCMATRATPQEIEELIRIAMLSGPHGRPSEPQGMATRVTPQENKELKTIAMFSGPHGRPNEPQGYTKVLVLAHGFALISCIPHLRRIISRHQAGEAVLERLHLVYETPGSMPEQMIQDFIHDELIKPGYIESEGELEKIVDVTIYRNEPEDCTWNKLVSGSDHVRDIEGKIPLEAVLGEETKRLSGRMLIITSLTPGYQNDFDMWQNGKLLELRESVEVIKCE